MKPVILIMDLIGGIVVFTTFLVMGLYHLKKLWPRRHGSYDFVVFRVSNWVLIAFCMANVPACLFIVSLFAFAAYHMLLH